MVITQHCEYTNCDFQSIVCFKMVNFTLCEFYLNKKKLKTKKGKEGLEGSECQKKKRLMV